MKDAVEKLKELGYDVKEYSTWEGDKGKFMFWEGNGQILGFININTRELKPMHGFYGNYLKSLSKKLKYKLVQ